MITDKLPWYRVWWLKVLVGIYRTEKFRNYIHQSFQASYYNIVLDPFREQFKNRDDVRQYYRQNMPYRWTLRHKLGQLDLGTCNLTQALANAQRHMPKSVVRHVDDVIHSIFVKTTAEDQRE